MAVTIKTLVEGKYAENAQTTQYPTAPTNCKTIIDKCTVSNVTAANATFAANVVASGGAAGATNNVLPTRTIAPGEVYHCPELVGQVLESGDFLSTIAGTASALVLRVSGREIT